MFSYSQIPGPDARRYDFSMSLNLNIRALRQAQKLTLETVAARAGISIPHLSEVERGKKNVNNHLLERIAAALGVRPEDLISGNDSTRADDMGRLLSVLSNLEPDDVDRVRAFAEALWRSESGSPHS